MLRACGGIARRGELHEGRYRVREFPVNEEALRGVSSPAIGMVQRFDEFTSALLGEGGGLVGDRPVACHNAPDPTEIVADGARAVELITDPERSFDLPEAATLTAGKAGGLIAQPLDLHVHVPHASENARLTMLTSRL